MSFITEQQHIIRVYAEDVDFMGIVYHANYLRYLERARAELLRSNNWTLSELIKRDVLFAIREITIKYLYPAKLDDVLTIMTQVKNIKACSFMFDQTVTNQYGRLVCEAQLHAVCVNGDLKPQQLPKLNG